MSLSLNTSRGDHARKEDVAFTRDGTEQSSAWQKILRTLILETNAAMAVVVSTLPRGSMAIVQSDGMPAAMLESYGARFHLDDRAALQAMDRRRAVRAEDCWPREAVLNGVFYRQFLQANGLTHIAAAPVADALFAGYPSAIEIYRTATQGHFTIPSLTLFADRCEMIQLPADKIRHTTGDTLTGHPFNPNSKPPVAVRAAEGLLPGARRSLEKRFFVFDRLAHPMIGTKVFQQLDEVLRRGMSEVAAKRIEGMERGGTERDAALSGTTNDVNGLLTITDRATLGERVGIADSIGDLWMFRLVDRPEFSACGPGPHVVFCLQPECEDWGSLASDDLTANPEMVRFIPAVKFLEDHFSRGPSLGEVAASVGLSPFHFHRTFTEVMGITPKHLLLDCQIERAKHELLKREQSLIDIAKTCGFAHQSHFTSRFKQATGLTPTRWRKMAAAVKSTASTAAG